MYKYMAKVMIKILQGSAVAQIVLGGLTIYDFNFYRAMHFSAKRGIEIAYCPSVRLSMTLCTVALRVGVQG